MFLGAKVKIHHYWIFSPRKRIEYSERRKGKEKERYSHAITVDAPAFVTLLRCGRIQGGKETTKGKWYGRLCSIRRHCGSRRKCMRFTCWSRHCGSQCFQSRVGTGTEQKRIIRDLFHIIGETYRSNIETNLSKPARKIVDCSRMSVDKMELDPI